MEIREPIHSECKQIGEIKRPKEKNYTTIGHDRRCVYEMFALSTQNLLARYRHTGKVSSEGFRPAFKLIKNKKQKSSELSMGFLLPRKKM